MGFSVTAAHVIFFVAILGAAGSALSAWWTTAGETDEARRAEFERADRRVHGEMTVWVADCDGGCLAGTRQVTIDVNNTGSTVLDATGFTYVIDGRSYTAGDVASATVTAPSAVASTELVLPGETLRVVLSAALSDAYDADSLPVQVVSAEGVVGRR